MIELTDDMRRTFTEAWWAAAPGISDEFRAHAVATELARPNPERDAAIRAVLPAVERDLRGQIADELEGQAANLRGSPSRLGELSFDVILGVEVAADAARTGKPVMT